MSAESPEGQLVREISSCDKFLNFCIHDMNKWGEKARMSNLGMHHQCFTNRDECIRKALEKYNISMNR